MMTDLAAGSRAAEQFQQDIAEAPYVSDITQTGAERKLQENRLALQYAPEEAAAKAEKLQLLRDQERINALYAPAKAATQQATETYNLQKTMSEASAAETERVFKEAGYKADTESTDKFKTWMTSDDGKKANDIQRLEKAAQFKSEFGLTKQAAELHTQIENINTKETANKAKELKNANESLASANALMQTIPDEDVTDYIKRLPNNLQKTITNRVGEDNWNKLDGKQKKALLKTLFQDAKQQVDVQIKEIEAQQAVDAAKEVTKRSNYRADKQAEFKGKGNSGDSSKQEAKNFSDVMRVDERLAEEGAKRVDALDEKIAAAEKAKVAADTKSTNWFDKDVEKERTAAATAVDQAKENKNKYVKQQLERRIKVIETAPTYPGKQAYIDSLKKELSLYGGDEPSPPVKEGAAAPVSAANTARLDADEAALKREIARTPAKETERLGILNKELEAIQARRTAVPTPTVPSNKYTVDNPAKPTSKAEYDALPPGSYYLQDGAIKQKSGGKTAEPAPTSKVAKPAVAPVPAAEAPNAQSKVVKFNPEGDGYDYETARKYGMGADGTGENAGHWGSVAPASKEDKQKYKLPDESYVILKGRTHETWQKAVNGEQERGFEIKKFGDRYFSVPVNEARTTTGKAETLRELANGKQKLPEFLENPTINLKGSPFITIDGKVVSPYTHEVEGTFLLLPGVINNKAVSGDAALAHYNKSKNKRGIGAHLGRFSSKEAATAYSYKLHEEQERDALKRANDKKEKELKELEKRNAKEKLKQLAGE
jgi:hypothetical protein